MPVTLQGYRASELLSALIVDLRMISWPAFLCLSVRDAVPVPGRACGHCRFSVRRSALAGGIACTEPPLPCTFFGALENVDWRAARMSPAMTAGRVFQLRRMERRCRFWRDSFVFLGLIAPSAGHGCGEASSWRGGHWLRAGPARYDLSSAAVSGTGRGARGKKWQSRQRFRQTSHASTHASDVFCRIRLRFACFGSHVRICW